MKVKKTYRLEQETIEELEKLCSDSGKSATEVIEGAIHDAIHVPDVERIGDGGELYDSRRSPPSAMRWNANQETY
jgi:predicted DNA-binding protein